MPLTPNAPDMVPQLTRELQSAPGYTSPSFDQLTNPALEQENAGRVQGQVQSDQDQSMRAQAFQTQQAADKQEFDLNAVLNPLKEAGAAANQTLLSQEVDRSTDAFNQLPEMAQQINNLDPADPNSAIALQQIMGKASSNPALFQSLQSAASTFIAKRQNYSTTLLGHGAATLQLDAATGSPTALAAWNQWQQDAKSGVDPTTMLGKFQAYQNTKAVALRASLQSQAASLGEYAPPLPPKLSAGIYDPDEIPQYQKDLSDALKQKNEGTKLDQIYNLKDNTAQKVQELKNEGRMNYLTAKFGQSPAGATAEGKQLISQVSALTNEMKATTDPDKKAQLQGELDGYNAEIAKRLDVPTAPVAMPGTITDPETQGAVNTLNSGIDYVQKQVDLGQSDLPAGAKIPGGIADPVDKGFGVGPVRVGATDLGGLTPNQYRLHHLQVLRDQVLSRSPGGAAPAAATAVAGQSAPAAQPSQAAEPAAAPAADPATQLVNPAGGAPITTAAAGSNPFAEFASQPAGAAATPATDAALASRGVAPPASAPASAPAAAAPKIPAIDPAKLSPKDQQFLAWAQANPQDPRAAKVLQLIQAKAGR